MKSYIYACFLAIFAPVSVPLVFGSVTLVDGNVQAMLTDLLTGSFILYCYLSSMVCVSYAYLIRLNKIKGKWWSNLTLPILVLVLLPIPVFVFAFREVSIESAVAGGAGRIGMHLGWLFFIVLGAFIGGFFIKKQVQPGDTGNPYNPPENSTNQLDY